MAERFLSIIPSLGHLLLDIWNPAGRGHPHEKVSDTCRKIWIQPEIKIILGVAWAWLLATVQEGIPSALADRDQRKKWESFFYYHCSLKDTLTAKNGDFSSPTRSHGFRISRLPGLFYCRLHRVKLVILWIPDSSTQYLTTEMIYIE